MLLVSPHLLASATAPAELLSVAGVPVLQGSPRLAARGIYIHTKHLSLPRNRYLCVNLVEVFKTIFSQILVSGPRPDCKNKIVPGGLFCRHTNPPSPPQTTSGCTKSAIRKCRFYPAHVSIFQYVSHVPPYYCCAQPVTPAFYLTPADQALARAAEASAAAAASVPGADETEGEDQGKVPEAVKAIEARLAGAPPDSVSVALRADSASEGRRDVVRAMFEVAWWPMLGAFSQVRLGCVWLLTVPLTVLVLVLVLLSLWLLLLLLFWCVLLWVCGGCGCCCCCCGSIFLPAELSRAPLCNVGETPSAKLPCLQRPYTRT